MRINNAENIKYGDAVISAAQKVEGVIVADSCLDWLMDQKDTAASDRTHPNEKGNRIVAQKVEELLKTTNKPITN